MGKIEIFKSVSFLTVVILLSKVIGFVRELVIASTFGATQQTDTFFIANGFVANFFYAVATAISVVFLPIYTDYIVNKTKKESGQFVTTTIVYMILFALTVVCLVEISAPWLSRILAPSYSPEQLADVTFYLRILIVSFLFSLVTSIFGSVLDAEKQYIYSRISGIVYSIVAVAAVLIFGHKYGVVSLAVSIIVAYLIQTCLMLWQVRKRVRFHLNYKDTKGPFKKLLLLAFPVLIGNATVQLHFLVDRAIAASLPEGAVSALSYGGTLNDFVISIFVVAIATVFFTEMSQLFAESKDEKGIAVMGKGVAAIVLALAPIAVFTVIMSGEIVQIVYFRGAFDANAAKLTAEALMYYAAGFLFVGIKYILVRLFYSRQETRVPMLIGVCSVVLNIILSIVLSRVLGIGGITLATSISEFASMCLFIVVAKKMLHIQCFFQNKKEFAKVGVSAALAGAAVLLMKGRFSHIVLEFSVLLIVFCVTYVILLLLMRHETVSAVGKHLMKRREV